MTDKEIEALNKHEADEDQVDRKHRRDNLRKLLVGGGVIGSSAIIPDKWSTAVVQSVVLPAHAQSSGISVANFNGQGPIP